MFGVLESIENNELQIKKKSFLYQMGRELCVFSNYLIISSLMYNGDET